MTHKEEISVGCTYLSLLNNRRKLWNGLLNK